MNALHYIIIIIYGNVKGNYNTGIKSITMRCFSHVQQLSSKKRVSVEKWKFTPQNCFLVIMRNDLKKASHGISLPNSYKKTAKGGTS